MKAIGNFIVFTIYAIIMIITSFGTFGFGILVLALHLFLMFGRASKSAEKASQKLLDSTMDGESIISSSIEMRPYALFTRRSIIGITNSRIIYLKRPILGGFKMIDIQWKDLIDAELSQNIIPNICGSEFSCSHSVDKNKITINIPTEIAFEIYNHAQKEEQAWEEKRRVRKIEEDRAKAGGTYITSPTSPPPVQSQPSVGTSSLDEIKKAKEMLDQGIISDAEFNELKSKILNQGRSI